jgi:hypothetical protein
MTARWSWKHWILCAIPLIAGGGALGFLDPLPQPLAYHDFADKRPLAGIPNFADLTSNLAFLIPGVLGLGLCRRHQPGGALQAWHVFFAGLVLVTFASGYYHWAPSNETLFWDRLAMTVAFTALYTALLAEQVGPRLEKLLPVFVLVGVATVFYWRWVDDLRLYFALQATVFTSALVMLLGFAHAFRQKAFIVAALACYAVAIGFDFGDRAVFQATGGAISGHTIKHLMAATAGFWGYLMLRARVLPG